MRRTSAIPNPLWLLEKSYKLGFTWKCLEMQYACCIQHLPRHANCTCSKCNLLASAIGDCFQGARPCKTIAMEVWDEFVKVPRPWSRTNHALSPKFKFYASSNTAGSQIFRTMPGSGWPKLKCLRGSKTLAEAAARMGELFCKNEIYAGFKSPAKGPQGTQTPDT